MSIFSGLKRWTFRSNPELIMRARTVSVTVCGASWPALPVHVYACRCVCSMIQSSSNNQRCETCQQQKTQTSMNIEQCRTIIVCDVQRSHILKPQGFACESGAHSYTSSLDSPQDQRRTVEPLVDPPVKVFRTVSGTPGATSRWVGWPRTLPGSPAPEYPENPILTPYRATPILAKVSSVTPPIWHRPVPKIFFTPASLNCGLFP